MQAIRIPVVLLAVLISLADCGKRERPEPLDISEAIRQRKVVLESLSVKDVATLQGRTARTAQSGPLVVKIPAGTLFSCYPQEEASVETNARTRMATSSVTIELTQTGSTEFSVPAAYTEFESAWAGVPSTQGARKANFWPCSVSFRAWESRVTRPKRLCGSSPRTWISPGWAG